MIARTVAPITAMAAIRMTIGNFARKWNFCWLSSAIRLIIGPDVFYDKLNISVPLPGINLGRVSHFDAITCTRRSPLSPLDTIPPYSFKAPSVPLYQFQFQMLFLHYVRVVAQGQ